MTTTIVLTVLALALLAAATAELAALLRSDGLGHRPLPRSHRDQQAAELTRWIG